MPDIAPIKDPFGSLCGAICLKSWKFRINGIRPAQPISASERWMAIILFSAMMCLRMFGRWMGSVRHENGLLCQRLIRLV